MRAAFPTTHPIAAYPQPTGLVTRREETPDRSRVTSGATMKRSETAETKKTGTAEPRPLPNRVKWSQLKSYLLAFPGLTGACRHKQDIPTSSKIAVCPRFSGSYENRFEKVPRFARKPPGAGAKLGNIFGMTWTEIWNEVEETLFEMNSGSLSRPEIYRTTIRHEHAHYGSY